jgi:hypothetical protein
MSELLTGRRRPPPLATANHEQWASWIVDHTAQQSAIPFDYGLAAVATFLGKEKALQYALDGAAAEASGDYAGAVKKYRAAFRLWPALDSSVSGGIPKLVREEADAHEYPVTYSYSIKYIDTDIIIYQMCKCSYSM